MADTIGFPWKVRIYAGKGPNGKVRQLARQGVSPTARQRLKDMEAARVALRTQVDARQAVKGTFGAMCDDWLKLRKKRAAMTTYYDTSRRITRIKAELGHIPLGKLTARDLDQFYLTLTEGTKKQKAVTDSTANHFHRIIHAVLRQAWKWDLVPANVAAKASPPPVPKESKTTDLPTAAEMQMLVAKARPNLKIAAHLAIATGARRGEVLGLRWSDITGTRLHVARAVVRVPGEKLTAKEPKSKRTRRMTLDADILAALILHRRYLEDNARAREVELADDGPIVCDYFNDPTGRTPMDPKWLTQAWAKHCKKHGVVCRFHDIRHFHATELIDKGVSVVTVAGRLGHARPSITTDIYAHALAPADDVAAEVIGAAMRTKPENSL